MEEIDHAERELRRGQILWFRGLNRIQTQVWAWWRGRRGAGSGSRGLLDLGRRFECAPEIPFQPSQPTKLILLKNNTDAWNEWKF